MLSAFRLFILFMFYPPLEKLGILLYLVPERAASRNKELTRVSAANVHILVAILGEDGPEHLVGVVALGADQELDKPELLGLGPADVGGRVPAPARGKCLDPRELLIRQGQADGGN